MGSAVDAAVLEPDTFRDKFVVEPRVNKRTNAGKEALEEFEEGLAPDVTILTPAEYEEAIRTRDAVLNNTTARMLLSEGRTQDVVHWNDPLTDAPCRMKYDWLRPDNVLIDLKTAEDASPDGFARAAFKYRYYVQDPFYTDGLWHGEDIRIDEFIFIVVEKQNLKEGRYPSPEKVGIYHFGAEERQLGRERYQKDLRVYQRCRTENQWPGYGSNIQPLRLPGWAYKK